MLIMFSIMALRQGFILLNLAILVWGNFLVPKGSNTPLPRSIIANGSLRMRDSRSRLRKWLLIIFSNIRKSTSMSVLHFCRSIGRGRHRCTIVSTVDVGIDDISTNQIH